jgi:anti-anti-sigma factor
MPNHSEFSLVFSRALGKVIVHIHGALDADTAQELNDRLVDAIDEEGNRYLVVDLKATTAIDADGFSVLLDALQRMQENGGELILSGPSSAVARRLEAAGLDKVFVVTPAWAHPVHGDRRTGLGEPGLRRSG